ncbi:MAG: hypothetical protein WD669_02295 [Pirellulales bacterium]
MSKQFMSILVMFLSVSAAPAANGDTIPQAAFDAWHNYRSSLAKQGVVIEEKTTFNGKANSTSVYRWNSANASVETDLKGIAEGGPASVVRNPQYAFKVVKQGGDLWSLRDLKLEAIDTSNPQTPIAMLTRDLSMPLLRGLLVENLLLPEALEDGSITVESVREINEPIPAVEVTIRGNSERHPRFSVRRGTLRLVPDYSWMITEAKFDLVNKEGQKGILVSKLDYSREFASWLPSNIPAVVSHTRIEVKWDNPNRYTHEANLIWKPEVPKSSDFRLSHYNLREPEGFEEPHWRPSMLFLVGASILIVFAVIVLALGLSAFFERKPKRSAKKPAR